jgi:hypothetical protein
VSPFQPRGSRALRFIIADLAASVEPGELLTFKQLGEAIGVEDDEPGRAQVRQAVSTARPIMLRDHKRALVAERGRGYRVALPGEFAGIAEDHRGKANRQMGKALAVIENADEKAMTAEELKRHRAVGVVIRNLHGRLTSAEQRLADLEAAVFGPPQKVIPGQVEEDD